ncbi:MAG: exodeoxyribonuclease VII small subunit [Lachnospiraceae bacterium]|jgi:exodeoxyribonuclease VII small subunit|nr:exodeoxyribonuclease VII small subunit [Lachnospiraceae bacterium]MCI9600082.1 exodeoxyribonuclease VII small subunit [Lachnospiraceae bacterium]
MAEELKEKKEEPGLEEAFGKIEGLLEKLGDRDVSLEDSFRYYQEGMELLKLCNARIDHVEKQMLQIDEEGQVHEFF